MIKRMKSPWRRRDEHWQEDRDLPVKQSSTFRRVLIRGVKLLSVAVLVGGIGAVSSSWLRARSENAKLAAVGIESSNEIVNEIRTNNSVSERGAVLGENDIEGVGVLASENYRVGQIILGGDVGVLSQGDEFTELSVGDIRGETLGSKNQNEGRALITWKTSKAARSTLSYGKTAGGSEKVIDEDGFGMSHSAVLSNLDLASTYLYTVSVRDRYGNEVSSDPHAIYTGTRVVSLFELITNALQEVFGWAVKR